MKLYLSSLLIGDHADVLLEMAGGLGARMAVVTNALDYIPVEAQLAFARAEFDPLIYFGDLGFDPSLIDLRNYFGRPADLQKVVLRHRVVWALGGNAFLLRRAMRDSGFDMLIGEMRERDMVYGGWSAGACVAGTALQPISLMDDPSVSAVGYEPSEPIMEGLGLIAGAIIPHFESNHPESKAAANAVQWSIEHGIKHLALRDGEVLVQDRDHASVLPRAVARDVIRETRI